MRLTCRKKRGIAHSNVFVCSSHRFNPLISSVVKEPLFLLSLAALRWLSPEQIELFVGDEIDH